MVQSCFLCKHATTVVGRVEQKVESYKVEMSKNNIDIIGKRAQHHTYLAVFNSIVNELSNLMKYANQSKNVS